MKGPGNVSVRLDLFPNKIISDVKGEPESEGERKSEEIEGEIFSSEETERSNRQVVFLDAEWDEIEREKSGLSSFVESVSQDLSQEKAVPSHFIEFVPTDSESVSSVTISLDDFGEESEEIVAVVSESETETCSFRISKEEEATLRQSTENSKIVKASCYVLQNGKITKPFYIVKKSPILREDGNPGGKPSDAPASNAETKTFIPLEKSCGKRKEIVKTPKNINQETVRIIEHVPKEKKIINNNRVKNWDNKNLKNPSSDSGANSCESEDLMWLLDFKLDDLFSESALPALSHLDDNLEQISDFPGKFVDVDGSVSNFNENDGDKARVEIGCQTETTTSKNNRSCNGKTGGKQQQQQQLQQQKNENKSEPNNLQTRTFSDLRYSENRKPPFTYTELIECALQEKGPLTVSEIYHWISETFPYYKSWDDRWKNSVRHNLSINPYFRKGTKARQGSGHLWTVNKSEDTSKLNSWKRQRFQEFEEFNKRLRLAGENERQEESLECMSPNRMLDETALATASIEDKENRRLHRDVLMAACVDNNLSSSANVSLEQSAEEILSGVKKTVEVQYLEPVKPSSPCENDFLNPISKEILMGECGLLNQIELNLTAETSEQLGIVDSITDAEHIFGIPDDLNFQYDMTGHTPQLLSLAK